LSKIYLDVRVPGLARTYEFSADNVMSVGKVKSHFASQISAAEGRDIFPDPGKVLFCSQALEGFLQDFEILGDVGIVSGDTIILL
jgi:hypothetical protein